MKKNTNKQINPKHLQTILYDKSRKEGIFVGLKMPQIIILKKNLEFQQIIMFQ